MVLVLFQEEDLQMMKGKLIGGKNSWFKGKLIQMIKGSNDKFNDYSISHKIRRILVHWGYELAKKTFFLSIKKSLSIQQTRNFTKK